MQRHIVGARFIASVLLKDAMNRAPTLFSLLCEYKLS
jgi:hypothetical protein